MGGNHCQEPANNTYWIKTNSSQKNIYIFLYTHTHNIRVLAPFFYLQVLLHQSRDVETLEEVVEEEEEEEEEGRRMGLQGNDSDHLLPPQPLLGGSSSLSEDSSDTTCLQELKEEQTIRHDPVVLPGVVTCDSDKGSAPHTPLSESRLPLSYLSTNLTHSRNISETPSLPPYISSSASSAYHSRNSSMASQLTSDCFDSDSQFTDIDSCIVLHSGGGGGGGRDRPVSLQDGRFRFPDYSPADEVPSSGHRGCYSVCDLSPGSMRMPDHLIVVSPVTLEDTLRQGAAGRRHCMARPAESFEEKHEAAALKSSEWIKREMTVARHSMVHVKVSSKTKHVVHFNVKAGDLIIWEFATKRKDIGLGECCCNSRPHGM